MKVKEESEKVVLKLNIQETKIMASGPITSWEIDGRLPFRRRRGQGPHLAKSWEPRGFSRVAAGLSSYDGDLRLPDRKSVV